MQELTHQLLVIGSSNIIGYATPDLAADYQPAALQSSGILELYWMQIDYISVRTGTVKAVDALRAAISTFAMLGRPATFWMNALRNRQYYLRDLARLSDVVRDKQCWYYALVGRLLKKPQLADLTGCDLTEATNVYETVWSQSGTMKPCDTLDPIIGLVCSPSFRSFLTALQSAVDGPRWDATEYGERQAYSEALKPWHDAVEHADRLDATVIKATAGKHVSLKQLAGAEIDLAIFKRTCQMFRDNSSDPQMHRHPEWVRATLERLISVLVGVRVFSQPWYYRAIVSSPTAGQMAMSFLGQTCLTRMVDLLPDPIPLYLNGALMGMDGWFQPYASPTAVDVTVSAMRAVRVNPDGSSSVQPLSPLRATPAHAGHLPDCFHRIPVDEQKNMIGEKIYPKILAAYPVRAAKITGMILEMEVRELLDLLDNPRKLSARSLEANTVLDSHMNSNAAPATEQVGVDDRESEGTSTPVVIPVLAPVPDAVSSGDSVSDNELDYMFEDNPAPLDRQSPVMPQAPIPESFESNAEFDEDQFGSEPEQDREREEEWTSASGFAASSVNGAPSYGQHRFPAGPAATQPINPRGVARQVWQGANSCTQMAAGFAAQSVGAVTTCMVLDMEHILAQISATARLNQIHVGMLAAATADGAGGLPVPVPRMAADSSGFHVLSATQAAALSSAENHEGFASSFSLGIAAQAAAPGSTGYRSMCNSTRNRHNPYAPLLRTLHGTANGAGLNIEVLGRHDAVRVPITPANPVGAPLAAMVAAAAGIPVLPTPSGNSEVDTRLMSYLRRINTMNGTTTEGIPLGNDIVLVEVAVQRSGKILGLSQLPRPIEVLRDLLSRSPIAAEVYVIHKSRSDVPSSFTEVGPVFINAFGRILVPEVSEQKVRNGLVTIFCAEDQMWYV